MCLCIFNSFFLLYGITMCLQLLGFLTRLKQCLSVFFEHYPSLSAAHKASNTNILDMMCIIYALLIIMDELFNIYGPYIWFCKCRNVYPRLSFLPCVQCGQASMEMLGVLH